MSKPLKDWAGTKQSDATKVNHDDKSQKGNFVSDPYSMGDPNAMGPSMRQVYDETAGTFGGADMHNDHYPAPLPHIDPSAADVGVGASDEITAGVTGKWPKGRYY